MTFGILMSFQETTLGGLRDFFLVHTTIRAMRNHEKNIERKKNATALRPFFLADRATPALPAIQKTDTHASKRILGSTTMAAE